LLQLADPTFFPVPYWCMALASAHKSPGRTPQAVKASSQSQIISPFFPSPSSSTTSTTPQPPLHQMRQYPTPISPMMIACIPRTDDHQVLLFAMILRVLGSTSESTSQKGALDKRSGLYCTRLAFKQTSFDPRKLPC
jgi:hypothetical protein